MLYLLALCSAVLVAVTFAYTAANYPQLPDRVPTHFGLSAKPDSYGPRPMAWLMPALQLGTALLEGGIAAERAASGDVHTALTLAAGLVLLSAIFLAAQRLTIETALHGPSSRLYRTFWIAFAVLMIVFVLAPMIFAR